MKNFINIDIDIVKKELEKYDKKDIVIAIGESTMFTLASLDETEPDIEKRYFQSDEENNYAPIFLNYTYVLDNSLQLGEFRILKEC